MVGVSKGDKSKEQKGKGVDRRRVKSWDKNVRRDQKVSKIEKNKWI